MRKKLLTKRQQIGIFNCQDPVALMQEYVSFTKAIMDAAEWKLKAPEYKTYPVKEEANLCENEKAARQECFNNLSLEDARFIFEKNHGHVYPEVFMKMLVTFPQKVSKEILVKYAHDAKLTDEVLFEAINILGKNARDIIIARGFMNIRLFTRIVKIFSKEEIKYIIIELAIQEDFWGLDKASEAKMFQIFSPEETKEMMKFIIRKTPGLDWETYPKIFDILPKEYVKEIIERSIEEDQDIFNGALNKIVEIFPKDEAKELLDAFFETSPGRNMYSEKEIKKLYKKLKK